MNITEKQESAELKRIYQRKAGELNLNHHKLAQLMDITQASVSHFINGRNPIPLERAIQFAAILECEVADFSPRLAVKAKNHGDAVPGTNEVVYVDVVLMNGEQKDIIKKDHLLVIHREKNTSKNLEKNLNILENRIYGRSEIFFGKLFG